MFQHVAQALRYAVRNGLLSRNPADGVELPRRSEGNAGQQHERRSLTVDELRAFLAEARGSRFDVLWQVMSASGCRPAEALGLTWADLSGDVLTFRRAVTEDEQSKLILGPIKTGKTRRTPLPPAVIDALATHRQAQREHILRAGPAYDRTSGLIFPNATGGFLYGPNLRERYFKPLLRSAGVQVRKGDGLYMLRHTLVTQLLLAAEAPQTVAERVGDTVTTIMQHYAHAVPGLQQKATETVAALLAGDF